MTKGPTDFQRWAAKLGGNLGEAAAAIGLIGRTKTSELSQGHRDLTTTERLAMSAVRAGLDPWTPENDTKAEDLRLLREILDRETERRKPTRRRPTAA